MKFTSAIQTTAQTGLPTSEAAARPRNAEEVAAVKANNLAMISFIMALNDSVIGVVYKVQSLKWPQGLGWMVWNALFKKFFSR